MEKPKLSLEEAWLSFFNDYLFAEGVITREECDTMRVAIRTDYRK